MDSENKQLKQFKIIYDWLQIARKSYYNLYEDLRLLMELIQIPVTSDQLQMLKKTIDPKGIKKRLQKQDFLHCFIVPEEKKKQKQKQIQMAFRHSANGQSVIQFNVLRQCLLSQGLNEFSTGLILKQMGDYETEDKKFDYRKFAAWHLQK